MRNVRFYTLPEANAKVPELEESLARVSEHVARARALDDQVNDLEVVWGSKVLDAACPDNKSYLEFKRGLGAEEEAVDGVLKSITGQGIEVKDLATGLVDFYAKRGGEVVYLCWRRGEPQVAFWHTLQGGFAGRKPIKEF